MNIKVFSISLIVLVLFLFNNAYAQYPSQNQQALQTDKTPAQLHVQNMNEKAAIDVADVAAVVTLSKGQRAQLMDGFVDIEEEKYQNNLTTNPNKMDVRDLQSKINREKTDLLNQVLTHKQLSVYYDKTSN